MVTAAAYARVVAQELSRSSARGLRRLYGDDDVRQELLFEAWRSSLRHDGRDNLGYVRQAVRNRVKDLHAQARAGKRVPHDRYGRPIAVVQLPEREHACSERSPEDLAAIAEIVSRILARLSEEDRQEWRRVVNGDELSLEFVSRARSVASLIGYSVSEVP